VLGDGRATGFAFVAERVGESAWLVTDGRAVASAKRVALRFASDRTLPAEVAFLSEERGFAVLRVSGPGLPRRIRSPGPTAHEADMRGVLVSPGRRPIPVTVFRAPAPLGTVESAEPPPLRLSGSLDASLSGSPVFSTEGRLLGMASIGTAQAATLVSADSLAKVFSGTVDRFEVRELSSAPGFATLEVEVWLLDPRGGIGQVEFHLRRKSEYPARPVPTPGQEWRLTSGGFAAIEQIRVEGEHGLALVRVESREYDDAFWAQISHRDRDGKTVFAPPREITLHFSGDSRLQAGAGPALDEVVVPLPSPVTNLCAAGGGKLVVLALKGSDTLRVWDTAGRRFARDIRLPSSNFVFAAGGDTALVYLPEDALLASYDLATGTRRNLSSNTLPGPVLTLVMGAANGGRAVAVVRASSGDKYGMLGEILLDVATLKPFSSPSSPILLSDWILSSRTPSYLSDSSLSRIAGWRPNLRPSGVTLWTIAGTTVQLRHEHDEKVWLSPSDDGKVYTGIGEILDAQLKVDERIPGRRLLAGTGGVFYLGFDERASIDLYISGTTTPVSSLGMHPGKPNETTTLLLASEGTLVMLGKEKRSLVQRNFDVLGSLAAAR